MVFQDVNAFLPDDRIHGHVHSITSFLAFISIVRIVLHISIRALYYTRMAALMRPAVSFRHQCIPS